MLTELEIQEIEQELAHCGQPQAAILPALRVVQQHHRWVSDEHLKQVAGLLGLSPEEVDSIATFYNLIYREPVGRHVILLCDSASCWIMGYNPLREYLTQALGIELGETTADDRFTLLPTACLGACDLGPAMMVDDDLHGPLTPDRIAEILEQYR